MLADALEFLFVFHGTNIIHLAQFVELAQGETCFAEIIFGDLAVVRGEILIGFRFFFVEFCQQHSGIYAPAGGAPPGAPPGAPAPDAGRTPPGGAAPGAGGAPAAPGAPPSSPAIS